MVVTDIFGHVFVFMFKRKENECFIPAKGTYHKFQHFNTNFCITVKALTLVFYFFSFIIKGVIEVRYRIFRLHFDTITVMTVMTLWLDY